MNAVINALSTNINCQQDNMTTNESLLDSLGI